RCSTTCTESPRGTSESSASTSCDLRAPRRDDEERPMPQMNMVQAINDEFGDDRVIDTPLSEGGIVGTAIGMALYGLVPVPEIQFADFIYPAYDQIVSELAKFRYRSGGEYPAKLVIRTPVGG